MRAHPRACGENYENARAALGEQGSSPRVRGKPAVGHRRLDAGRLIPARAGKTHRSGGHQRQQAAHPRVCGENAGRSRSMTPWGGSSPRVRGKLDEPDEHILGVRLIPARAGKTPRPSRFRGCSTAHPRACGENAEVDNPASRMCWLIPARAGKTMVTVALVGWPGAHPRACGENGLAGHALVVELGSSPRVRGKRSGMTFPYLKTGLIPARAGKTTRRPSPRTTPTAHPRACGENPLPISLC